MHIERHIWWNTGKTHSGILSYLNFTIDAFTLKLKLNEFHAICERHNFFITMFPVEGLKRERNAGRTTNVESYGTRQACITKKHSVL